MSTPARGGALRPLDLLNPAGALTGARLGIAVAFPLLAADPTVALCAYLFAMGTDVLDGAVARWRGQDSHTGAVADGWTDKILHINAAWAMVNHGYMPGIWMLFWFTRELIQWGMVMTIIGDFHSGRLRVQETSAWGRVTAVLLFICFITTLLGWVELAWTLTGFTAISGLLAGGGYLKRHLEDRRRFD